MQTIVCPSCGTKREVSESYIVYRKNRNFLCTACAHINKSPRSLQVPCGEIRPGKQRCDQGLQCRHYDYCLNAVAKANWPGWQHVSKIKQRLKASSQ